MQKQAIITGAGTGIGKNLAQQLLARGHRVLAVGRRIEPLQELQQEDPSNIDILTADIGTEAGRDAIVAAAEKYQKVDFMVHNAAAIAPFGGVLGVELADWQKMQQVNIEGPWFLTKGLLPKLENGGRILHVGSGGAHIAIPEFAAYCVSKAALYNLYLNMRDELKPYGIEIASVAPGIVDTPMQKAIRASEASDSGKFTQLNQSKKLVKVEHVGMFMAWLLCEVDAEKYSAEEWDIYDSSHHHKWITDSAPKFPWG